MLWRSRSIRLFGEEGTLWSASCFQMIQSSPVHHHHHHSSAPPPQTPLPTKRLPQILINLHPFHQKHIPIPVHQFHLNLIPLLKLNRERRLLGDSSPPSRL